MSLLYLIYNGDRNLHISHRDIPNQGGYMSSFIHLSSFGFDQMHFLICIFFISKWIFWASLVQKLLQMQMFRP